LETLGGLLSVVLRGFGLAALAASVGGSAFALLVLSPFPEDSPLAHRAFRRSLWLIVWGSVGVASSQLLLLLLQPWSLADEAGWPFRQFFSIQFAKAGLLRVVLGIALAVVSWLLLRRSQSTGARVAVVTLALLLGGSSAWLSHAVGRLENRGILMGLDALHQIGAAVWVGGVIHLVAFWFLWRGSGDNRLASRVLRRFSPMALASVGAIVGAGAALSLSYVDGIDGLLGTGYGIMLLTKLTLLAAALLLGGLNFLAVRRVTLWDRAVSTRLWLFTEAEVGLGLTLLLAAASLTSLPPARDVREDRATIGEVASRFVPRLPRVTTPKIDDLLASAAPLADTLAERKPEEYAWSEYNHHMAGLFVVALGLLAWLERTGRAPWARHWPFLFLGLAAFLFVRNDPRAWPLGPAGFWESMVFPDVLQHRAAVALLVALAVFEWRVRAGRFRSPRWGYVFPLLCAAGGALLLTHSHAMFNLKAEFLTEVTHTPLGVLAVFTGWGRWLELRLRPPENALPGRVWVVSMILLGALLVFYREG
jgi:putative copper resistance protein D